ncbi:hypothetical protein I3760_04G080800 [Carya illinoinensis]|nr:hypothetical protein I3760_04G080800 [Carya illinoinensis]
MWSSDLQGLRCEPIIVPHVSGAHKNTPATLYLIAFLGIECLNVYEDMNKSPTATPTLFCCS